MDVNLNVKSKNVYIRFTSFAHLAKPFIDFGFDGKSLVKCNFPQIRIHLVKTPFSAVDLLLSVIFATVAKRIALFKIQFKIHGQE